VNLSEILNSKNIIYAKKQSSRRVEEMQRIQGIYENQWIEKSSM
jgi:hypothetical protein